MEWCLASILFRRFGEEIGSLVGRRVVVETSDGKSYQGDLQGVAENLNLILDNVAGAGEGVFKMVLNGSIVKEIKLMEKPFDLRALADRLNKVFPGLVNLRDDIGAIIVMEKIKITEQGVMEGSGLAAERARTVFEEFTKEREK